MTVAPRQMKMMKVSISGSVAIAGLLKIIINNEIHYNTEICTIINSGPGQ